MASFLFSEFENSDSLTDGEADSLLAGMVVDYLSGLRYAHSQEEHERVMAWLASPAGEAALKFLGVRDDLQEAFFNICNRLGRKTLTSPGQWLGGRPRQARSIGQASLF